MAQEARVERSNDEFMISLVDGREAEIDMVPWHEARERVATLLGNAPLAENVLTAIFTGRAHGI